MTNKKIENSKGYTDFYKDSVPEIVKSLSLNDIIQYLSQKDLSDYGLLAMFIDESTKIVISIYGDKSIFIWNASLRESQEFYKAEFLCNEDLKHPGRFRRIF